MSTKPPVKRMILHIGYQQFLIPPKLEHVAHELLKIQPIDEAYVMGEYKKYQPKDDRKITVEMIDGPIYAYDSIEMLQRVEREKKAAEQAKIDNPEPEADANQDA
jgi:hypothetical protein